MFKNDFHEYMIYLDTHDMASYLYSEDDNPVAYEKQR